MCCNEGTDDARESCYCSATRHGERSWPIRAPALPSFERRFLPWRTRVTRMVWQRKYLRVIRARGDRILQTAGYNHMLTMAALRNGLLLSEAGIAPEIVKGDEYALQLVKTTGTGSLRRAAAPPSTNGRRPACRAPRIASPLKEGQCPQGRARQLASTLGPRWSTFATPWRPTVYPPATNIPQAAARTGRPCSRQQPTGAASGSTPTSQQLWEGKDQHREEQAVQVSLPDAPPGRHGCCNYHTVCRPYHHLYKARD